MFFRFKIIDGKMEELNRKLLQSHISRCAPGKYVMTIEKDYPTRSSQENRYYWGLALKIIGDELGYTPEECHTIFGEMFLSYEKNGRRFVRTTTKLKTVEFEEYIEKVRRFAAMELHVYLPLPNEAPNVSARP